ncbi:MAG: hypothetical protein LRY73_12470 [Bacillus sp. (in: Bacteria)]|nr:hypothetical protein [Bacillus sp. (in: firmicutes)]
MQDAMRSTAAAKVDNSVLNEFNNEEYVSVLVEFQEQVDTSKVAEAARNNLGDAASAYHKKNGRALCNR